MSSLCILLVGADDGSGFRLIFHDINVNKFPLVRLHFVECRVCQSFFVFAWPCAGFWNVLRCDIEKLLDTSDQCLGPGGGQHGILLINGLFGRIQLGEHGRTAGD